MHSERFFLYFSSSGAHSSLVTMLVTVYVVMFYPKLLILLPHFTHPGQIVRLLLTDNLYLAKR